MHVFPTSFWASHVTCVVTLESLWLTRWWLQTLHLLGETIPSLGNQYCSRIKTNLVFHRSNRPLIFETNTLPHTSHQIGPEIDLRKTVASTQNMLIHPSWSCWLRLFINRWFINRWSTLDLSTVQGDSSKVNKNSWKTDLLVDQWSHLWAAMYDLNWDSFVHYFFFLQIIHKVIHGVCLDLIIIMQKQ